MSSFREIQEKFKLTIKKEDIKNLPIENLNIGLAPIKFELIKSDVNAQHNEEYHIFLMMQDRSSLLTNIQFDSSEETIKNIIKDKLNIILPVNKNNTVKLFRINAMVYVFDGSKLNIEMINYLNKLNGYKREYKWCDINLGTPYSSVASELKEALIREIANGRIFE